MSLTKTKAETESRMSEEKRNTERKRNLIILIEKYLLGLGYLEGVIKIEQESNISLDKWDTADNIDLYMIMMEYQYYHEKKFDKPPKLVKKVDETAKTKIEQLRKNAMKNKNINSTINKDPGQKESSSQQHLPPTKPNFKKRDSQSNEIKSDKNLREGLELQGNSISKKEEEANDERFDVRVLKGIPDYSDVPQYRQLAAYLQRDILVENPNVKFSDVVGLEDAKRLLKQAVLLPLKYPDYFVGILEPWKGVLLYGPPGTGKTMLAKSVATQCKTTFFNISASSVVSKWRGQSQKLIRVLFELARFYQPSTIFIDQIDSIMSQRGGSGAEHEGSRRMKTELLLQMDGVIKKKEMVFVLAASNLPWDLDIAMLRRLEKRILVGLPCLQARENLLRFYLPASQAKGIDYNEVAKALEGYSGSDIKLVCKEAAMKKLRILLMKLEEIDTNATNAKHSKFKAEKEDLVQPEPVQMEDLLEALKTTKKSAGLSTKKYESWAQEFGSV